MVKAVMVHTMATRNPGKNSPVTVEGTVDLSTIILQGLQNILSVVGLGISEASIYSMT